jgi:hypothetical protein
MSRILWNIALVELSNVINTLQSQLRDAISRDAIISGIII